MIAEPPQALGGVRLISELAPGPNGCECTEMAVKDREGFYTRIVAPGHDCRYVAARNALIPTAMLVANEAHDRGRRNHRERMPPGAGAAWSAAFSAEMKRLVAAAWKDGTL